MSLGNPTNIIILALLGIAAVLFIVASFTGGSKWRRLYDEEREEYAGYAESADTELRAARERIAELEHAHGDLQQQHSDALASIAQLKAEATARSVAAAPLAAVPVAPAPIDEAPPLAAKSEPAEEALPAVAEPEPVAPAIIPEHRPIAPEIAVETSDARPIAAFGSPITELPPAPIHGSTPLRAVEPPEPESVPQAPAPAEPVTEAAPSSSEPAHTAPETTVEATHGDKPEHPHLATLAHLAEGAAVAEVAHLAWNAYSDHKHHAEAEHAAELAKAPEPEAVPRATLEHGVEAPHAAPSAPVADAAEVAAAAEAPAKTWFGSAKRDDLTRMRGVDTVTNTRLFGLGVTSFDDIVHLSQEDEMALEQRLGLPAGYITREQWRDQAGLLRVGKDDEFNERFGSAHA